MRLALVAAVCLSMFGLAVAADAQAAFVKMPTNIPAQGLGPALKTLAKDRGFQVVFRSEVVGNVRTGGAAGNLTTPEALSELLKGTDLSYSYLDESTVTIVPRAELAPAPSAESYETATPPISDSTSVPKEGQKSGKIRLAQVDQGPPSGANSLSEGDEGRSSSSKKTSDDEKGLAEILVKGSRILNVDVTRTQDDIQPYTILDSKMIEQSGATSVEDLLTKRLTMNTTFATNAQAYGGNGSSTSSINLRGLGANETLILIDGRRSAGVTIGGAAGQPDINGIPISAVERIEILPSSASAIYGGSAIGGVVNVILKKNFSGGDLRYSYENTTSGSAPIKKVDATYGFSLEGGKTQIMVAGQYAETRALQLQDRLSFVQRGVSTILANSPSYLYDPFDPFQGATPNIADVDDNSLTLKDGRSLNSPITSIPAGTAPGANISSGLLANAGKYNLNLGPGTGEYGLQSPIGYAPQNKFLMASLRREMASFLDAFAEVSTASNTSREVYNQFSTTWYVPPGAPTNPFQQDVAVTFPSAVPSASEVNSVTQRLTTGLVVRLPAAWSAELDYTWSRNSFSQSEDTIDTTAFNSALADGTVNPFVDTVAHPLTLAPYLAPITIGGNSTLNDVGLRASGPIGSLPAGRPTLTVGLEHRKEGFHTGDYLISYPLNPDNNQDTRYFGQSQSTDSIYLEGNIPLLAARNAVPVVHSLDLQVAARSERYSVFSGTFSANIAPDGSVAPGSPPQDVHQTIHYTSTNPTVGFKLKTVADLTFRASYASAFLPPTAYQLLPDPTPLCCYSITDPQNGQTYQVNRSIGGNPSLKPQSSRAWDYGVIWEPTAAPLQGLRINLEYYRISQPDFITSPTPQQVVSSPAYADRVTRDPTTGRITIVNTSPVNALQYKTSGWDLTLDYQKPTSFGTFDLHAQGTLIAHDLRQYAIGQQLIDYAGFPAEGGEGKIKANATLSWEYRHWTIGWTALYFSSYWQDGAPGGPTAIRNGHPFTYYTNAQGSNSIPSQAYHSLFGGYDFGNRVGGGVSDRVVSNLTVQFGVKNIFNKLPPFDAYSYPYFYSSYGDPRLRDYWISIRKGFGG